MLYTNIVVNSFPSDFIEIFINSKPIIKVWLYAINLSHQRCLNWFRMFSDCACDCSVKWICCCWNSGSFLLLNNLFLLSRHVFCRVIFGINRNVLKCMLNIPRSSWFLAYALKFFYCIGLYHACSTIYSSLCLFWFTRMRICEIQFTSILHKSIRISRCNHDALSASNSWINASRTDNPTFLDSLNCLDSLAGMVLHYT